MIAPSQGITVKRVAWTAGCRAVAETVQLHLPTIEHLVATAEEVITARDHRSRPVASITVADITVTFFDRAKSRVICNVDGRGMRRCRRDKLRWRTEEDARAFNEAHADEHDHVDVEPYSCSCGWIHLGSPTEANRASAAQRRSAS